MNLFGSHCFLEWSELEREHTGLQMPCYTGRWFRCFWRHLMRPMDIVTIILLLREYLDLLTFEEENVPKCSNQMDWIFNAYAYMDFIYSSTNYQEQYCCLWFGVLDIKCFAGVGDGQAEYYQQQVMPEGFTQMDVVS
ncbi:uncharacterized protein LOC131051679 [Cryptomeria japonica]|uniref:uncharacterized protein LOC131051679 n=1 Tax=Cryptomeria japonica TaxID=3369 RepID=UPI0027DA2F1B|nr:uncharacterized protein LOC131051679 [Cryptomeria japonica]XP_059069294.1 uncharacterized protein LOC131051679 [Cryptomeria japonica]